jgi:hypothetical protein
MTTFRRTVSCLMTSCTATSSQQLLVLGIWPLLSTSTDRSWPAAVCLAKPNAVKQLLWPLKIMQLAGEAAAAAAVALAAAAVAAAAVAAAGVAAAPVAAAAAEAAMAAAAAAVAATVVVAV